MSKVVSIVIAVLLVFVGGIYFSGCNNDVYYTVKLDYNNGGYREIQKMANTTMALNSFRPSRPGYTFDAWDYDNQKIDKNMVINAIWKSNKYKIYYHSNNEDDLVFEQEVTYNHSADIFSDIFNNSGYNLKYWKTQDNQKYGLASSIKYYLFESDLHLYAHWEKESNCIMQPAYAMPTKIQWNSDGVTETMTVDIPKVTAVEKTSAEEMNVQCRVVSPNGMNLSVKTYAASEGKGNSYYFDANMQGEYVIKYTATSSLAKQYEEEYYLVVGDNEKPMLIWENGGSIASTLMVGDCFGIDFLKDINLLDDCSDEEYLWENITITMTGPDGLKKAKIERESGAYWELNEEGNYMLKLSIKDEAGNTNVYSYQIAVIPAIQF